MPNRSVRLQPAFPVSSAVLRSNGFAPSLPGCVPKSADVIGRCPMRISGLRPIRLKMRRALLSTPSCASTALLSTIGCLEILVRSVTVRIQSLRDRRTRSANLSSDALNGLGGGARRTRASSRPWRAAWRCASARIHRTFATWIERCRCPCACTSSASAAFRIRALVPLRERQAPERPAQHQDFCNADNCRRICPVSPFD